MHKRFALFGTGFWSQFQLGAWEELEDAQCVALYNRTRSKAEALAERFDVPAVYDDPEALLAQETLDFVDVVTNVETHADFVRLVAAHGLPVICQKPMATSLTEAEEMVATCQEAGVPFFVHENWRWQRPIRKVRAALAAGTIGAPFRARLQFNSSYPVFENQPFLKELDQFIIADMGSHILDTARFLFGEAHDLYAQAHQVHGDIQGEDVATVMMHMGETGTTVIGEMSYASRLERERFPETFMLIEGDRGSIELGPDYWVRVTTDLGTESRRYPPVHYDWADPAYDLVQASIVPCNADLLQALQSEAKAETTGADNLETVRLVFAAYESVADNQVIRFT